MLDHSNGGVDRRSTSDEHDRNVWVTAVRCLQHAHAIHGRQGDVTDDDVVGVDHEEIDGFLAIASWIDLEADGTQGARVGTQLQFIVLGHEHTRSRWGGAAVGRHRGTPGGRGLAHELHDFVPRKFRAPCVAACP